MERTVLVTGCASGIGRETALAFNEQGWVVYATDVVTEGLEELGEKGCKTAELDVTDQQQVAAVVERIVDERGRIDCLVNNAGAAKLGALEDTPASHIQKNFDVNLIGPHHLVREVLPHMRERGEGSIINVSSGLAHVSLPGAAPYSLTKHAMKSYTETLRVEVAPFGIDVVHIEPGFTKTGFEQKIDTEFSGLIEEDSPYEQLYDNALDVNENMMNGPLVDEPSKVAKAILKAAHTDDPSLRKPVGLNVRLNLAEQWLPKRVRLWVKKKMFWR